MDEAGARATLAGAPLRCAPADAKPPHSPVLPGPTGATVSADGNNTMANKARDNQGQYLLGLDNDEAIMAAAEDILRRRMDRGEALTDPSTAGNIFRMRLGNLEREHFSVAFLDTRHRVLQIEDLFLGAVDGCEVSPQVVARRALELNAVAVILAHNHPSTNPEPSAADRTITTRLKAALALIEVRLLDHFIIAGNNPPVSMAAKGWV